jgi:hypothetical protein
VLVGVCIVLPESKSARLPIGICGVEVSFY